MEFKSAALYIRVSTEEQARDGYSVDAQKDHLKHFAEKKDIKLLEYIQMKVYQQEKNIQKEKVLWNLFIMLN